MKDICKDKKNINMTIPISKHALKFTDAPVNLQDYHNKLWLKADQTDYGPEIDNSNSKFMGYINISDMSFIDDTSTVKFPETEKFPKFGYTMNKVEGKCGSALYASGGVVYSKSLDAYISSNSFFKYNYTTDEWVDMTSKYNGKLDPIYGHKSVVMDSRYIVLFGGKIAKDPSKNSILNINDNSLFKVSSIYNLVKFDTVTNYWESTVLNTSMFDSSIASLQLTDFSINFYKNKVYTLGGLATSNDRNTTDHNTKLGILDYSRNQWSWSPVFDKNGNVYGSYIEAKYSIIYNHQIILISGKSIEKNCDEFQLFDLESQRMTPMLKASVLESDADNRSGTQDQSSTIPSYAITLIAVSCTVLAMLIIFFIYLKYNRNKETPQNLKTEPKKLMEAIWSNPVDPNMVHNIYEVKENSIYFDSEFKYYGLKLTSPLFEKPISAQRYPAPSVGTTNTSTTLQSKSSNY